MRERDLFKSKRLQLVVWCINLAFWFYTAGIVFEMETLKGIMFLILISWILSFFAFGMGFSLAKTNTSNIPPNQLVIRNISIKELEENERSLASFFKDILELGILTGILSSVLSVENLLLVNVQITILTVLLVNQMDKNIPSYLKTKNIGNNTIIPAMVILSLILFYIAYFVHNYFFK